VLRIVQDNLEEWARVKVQELLQSLLVVEIAGLLGREKLKQRKGVDSPAVYRNGHSNKI
jgi:hypothetical protein